MKRNLFLISDIFINHYWKKAINGVYMNDVPLLLKSSSEQSPVLNSVTLENLMDYIVGGKLCLCMHA